MPAKSIDPRLIVGTAFVVGIAIRVFARGYVTPDWEVFLLPWYEHAKAHGLSALKDEFTNYAPFYTYFVIVVAAFDGLASPVTLIKCISYPFELGCALVGARLVSLVDPRPQKSALAFAALWLSPIVLHNGPLWAQCDALWTFFLLLALWAACLERTRWAIFAFAVAVSIKAQAVFLGPFVLGLALRRRENLVWFLLLPAVYFAVALPVLLAGRPFADVARIYLNQAGYFPSLWKGAPNLYGLIPEACYHPGLAIGLAIATCGGVGLAWSITRARAMSREALLLAAAISLASMPFLLPRMHERFFYAFDAVIVILACIRPIYIPIAVAALTSSALCYLPFDGFGNFGQAVTGLQSLINILYLTRLFGRAFAGRPVASEDAERDRIDFLRPTAALWFAYLAYSAAKNALPRQLVAPEQLWPTVPAEPIGLAAFLLCLILSLALLRPLMPGARQITDHV